MLTRFERVTFDAKAGQFRYSLKSQRDSIRSGVVRSAVKNKVTNKNMKTLNSILLAGAVALGFTLTTTVRADEPFLSPKAKANQISRVSSVDTSPNLVSGNYLGALAKTEANRARVVSSGGATTPNLVSGNYLGAGVKNPHWRMSPSVSVPFIAQSTAMTCEAGCTMACCAKK